MIFAFQIAQLISVLAVIVYLLDKVIPLLRDIQQTIGRIERRQKKLLKRFGIDGRMILAGFLFLGSLFSWRARHVCVGGGKAFDFTACMS